MQIGLAVGDVAREKIGGRPPFENASDLLGDEGGAAILVIDAGEAEDDRFDGAAMLLDQRLRFALRARLRRGFPW